MANQDDFLSVRSSTLNKYNVQSGSTSTSSREIRKKKKQANKDFMAVRSTMRSKYSDENAQKNRNSVSDWSKRFEKATKGYSQFEKQRNGGYTRDASGGYASEIDSLIQDYESIRDYAGRNGLPNAQKYYKQLQQIRQNIRDTDTVMSQFENEGAYSRYISGQRGTNTHAASGNSASSTASTGSRQQKAQKQVSTDTTGIDSDILALQEQIRELQHKQASYGRSRGLSVSKQEKENIDSDLKEAKAKLAELKQRKNNLRAESDSFIADENRAKTAAESAFTGGQQRRTQKQVSADITGINNDISALQDQILGLQQKQAGYARSFTVNKEEKDRVKAELEDAETKLAALEQRKTELFTEADSFISDEYRTKIAALPENDRKALQDSRGNYNSMAYGYLLRKGYNRKEIDAMWETMQRDKNAELSESAINGTYDWAGQNAGTAVAGFGGARAGNLAGAVTGTFQVINDMARHYLRGSPYSTTDPNSLGYLPSRMAGAADQAVSEAIEGEDGGIVRKGAAFVYRGAANAADNLTRMAVATAIGGPAAGAAVNSAFSFTQGFQSSYREAVERGGSPVQALLMGSIDGGMEVFTESRTFERWVNLKDPELIAQGVYEWLKTASIGIGNEITEEEASYIANTIADLVIMADKGENAEYIKQAVANGLTPDEAKWELVKKIWDDMKTTAADTAMSTLIMDGVTGTVSNYQYKKTYGQYADDLIEAGLESPEGSKSNEIAKKMQAKKDAGKSVSGADIRNIMAANDKLNHEEALQEEGFLVSSNSENENTEIEFAENPSSEVQQALKDAGFKWSKRDKVWYGNASQEQARQIVQEAMGTQTEAATTSETETVGSSMANVPTAQKEADTAEENKPFEISPTAGKTLLNQEDGSTVETAITGIASIDGGKLMLNVIGQAEPVSADKIAYANAGDAALYHIISKMDITPAQANELVSLAKIRNNQDGQFAFGIQQMYALGESGIPRSKASNSIFGGQLSSAVKEYGYYLGRQAYDKKIAQAEAKKSASASAQKARAAMSGTKVNGVQYDGLNVRTGEDGSVEIDGVTLNEQQKVGIRASEMLASMGLNVHVFQSQTDANGKPIGENGSYSMKDGSIHIDLNAGSTGQGVMAYTIAHEFTHFMEQQSPKMFQSFTDALFEVLDTDVEAEISEKAAKLRRQRPDAYRNASRQKLMEDARSEVVAEACETMLTDTDAAERIGQSILNRNKSLLEKIVDWFKGIAEKLRKAYEGMNPDSAIARNAKKTIQQVDGLVQMWADMAVDAAENYRTAEAGNEQAQNENRYSMRDIDIDRDFIDFNNRNARNEAEDRTADILVNNGKSVVIDTTTDNPIITDTDWSDAAESRKVIREILKAYLGEDVRFDYNGQYATAYLTQKGIDHAVSGMNTKHKALAVNQFKDLITNAEYSYSSTADHQKLSGKVDWDYFVSVADFGGDYLPIVFAIRTIDTDTRSQIYSIATKENPGSFRGAGTQNKTANGHPSYEESLSSDRIIRGSNENVKHSDRDSDYMELAKDPEKNRDQLQQMVNQAAKDAGYTDRMWHGTPYGGFTKFKEWSYFTPHQEYADRYQNPSASSIRGRYNPATNPQTYGVFVKAENAFDTRKKKYRDLFNREFYRQWGNGAPLSEMGLPDWTDGSDLVEFFEENDYDYDAIYLDEGADGGYGEEVKKRGLSMMVRDSAQVKSADPVTYDEDGNVIPLSKRFDAENMDIRYSDRESEDTRTYAELTEALNTAYQKERELNKRYRDAQSEPNLLKAMEEYSTLYFDLKPLSRKVRRGEATEQEQQQYSDIKQRRDLLLKEAERIQEQLGISEIAQELQTVREQVKQLREASDIAWEREGTEKENKAIAKSGLTSEEYFRKKAAKTFRYTANFNEAGYLLPDGKMLNFSGGERNRRAKDHREIGAIYEATNGSTAMNRFMRDGNIRIMAESPGIDLASSTEPTEEQYSMIRKFINASDGDFYVDFSDENGKRVGSYSYEGNARADRILNDIRYFYENGTTRVQSTLSMFYSYREDEDISRQNMLLRDDITDLQRLLEIRKDVLSKGVANSKEVRSVASKLLDSSSRTMDTDSRKTLEEMIQETFGLFARPDSSSDEVAMKIMENLHNIAEYVIDEGEVSTPADPRAQEVLEEIKGQRFRLSDSQKAEVNHAFGSVAAFRKMLAGTVILDSNANQTLDELWANRLSSVGQEYFRPDTNEGDQPSALVSAIGNLKDARQMDEGWGQISPDEFMWDVMNAVYGIRPMTEGDWNAQARKILDRHEKRVAEMQNAYEARMRDQNETISEGQRYYTKKVTDLEGKIGELQAELDRAAKADAADLSIMEREFNRLARAYESTSRKKENSIDALRERLKKEARSHREDNAQWEKEFNRLLKEYQASGESLQKMAQQRQEKLESRIAELKAEKDRLKKTYDTKIANMEYSKAVEMKTQEALHEQRLKEVREEMRLDAESELDRVVGNFKDNRKAAVENRHRTEYRQQIHKMADKFHKMATAPAKANTAHAPVGLVSAVAKFCEIFAESEERAVEFASNALDSRETDMLLMNDLRGQTKTRAKEADVINRQRDRLLKKSETIAAMKKQYEYVQKDNAFAMFYDEHVDLLLNEMSKQMEGTDIYEMNTEQLKQVYNTMQALMHTITNANRVFSMEKEKTLIGVTKKLGAEIDANQVSHGAIATAVRRYGMWQMTPDTFFNFLCGYTKDNEGKAVQKMFENGSDRMLSVQRDFYQMFRHLTESTDKETAKHIRQMMKNPMKEMIDWGLKDASGKTVKTTRDMMLQAYMLLNQQDSFESLVYGGFKIPNAKAYYDGHVDNAYGDAEESTLLSAAIGESYMDLVHEIRERQKAIDDGGMEVQMVEQLQEEIGELRSRAIEMVEGAKAKAIALRDAIEKQLTSADLDAIETAKKWYKYTGQLMTDVYLQMYGYKPNLVEGYVPIHRDLTTVKTDIREGEENKAFNLENSGFTKDRVKSVAPILLTGFFQELSNQQQKISRYYGFALVQKDFNRIWNLKMPGARTTINSKIAAKYGTGKSGLGVSGERYVQNYIQSVAGVSANDDILGKFYGNSASATLSLNPRVAVSQLASIPTASAIVGWKSMAAGFAKGISTSLSTEKKNLLANDSVWFFQRYRGAGGITELSDLKATGGMWSRIATSSVGKHLFNWCQTMDVFATASMWAMAEDYVQSNGMKATDDGYKLAVEQCYADIIRKSQPNYTVTERSDMLRDKRAGMKLLTMYKTQSNQNLNILVNSIGEYRAAVKAESKNHTEENKAYLKTAQKNLANGITSVTLGGTVAFVLLRTLVNFVMGKVEPYKDDETGELTAEELGKAVMKEILSSVSGMFALGGQLFDIVSSVVTGGRYYGISDTAIESLTTMAESAVTLMQRMGDENKKVEWSHVEKLLSSTLATCGIPYKNAKSFLGAAEMWYSDLTNGTLGQYDSEATTKQYRARILKYWQSGDMDKIADSVAALAAGSDKDTDEEVAKDVSHGFANNYLKEKVKQGEVVPEDAIKLLEHIGHDDAENTVNKWVFAQAYPDSKMTDSGIKFWYQNQDIAVDVVEAAFAFYSSTAADKDANGKSVSGSKKQKAMDYISLLPISKDQQRRLFIGLNAGNLKGTPWE